MNETILDRTTTHDRLFMGGERVRKWELVRRGTFDLIRCVEYDGESTVNQYGGIPARHVGEPKYIARLWRQFKEHT